MQVKLPHLSPSPSRASQLVFKSLSERLYWLYARKKNRNLSLYLHLSTLNTKYF